MRWAVAACLLAGCSRVATTSGDDTNTATLAVTVAKQPPVHDVVSLTVTLTNGGSTTSDTVQVSDTSFPLIYEADPPGMVGTLDIKVEAFDINNLLIGRGETQADVAAESAAVTLQSMDFVINNVYAGNQFLTNDFETVGLQLATENTAKWMAVFREDCSSCNILGRGFDASGRPIINDASNAPFQFSLNTSPNTSSAIPTLAMTIFGMVALWDFTAPSGGAQGIACRPVHSAGPEQLITSEAADVVSATGVDISDRVFVTWQAFQTSQVVRTMMVSSTCNPLASPMTVSQTSGQFGARRAHVASAGSTLVYTWIVDGDLHARFGLEAGTLAASEMTLLTKTATQEIEFVRVVRLGQSNLFALAVRWAAISGTGPGKIELYVLTPTGVLNTPLLVTDQSGSDFASVKGLGLASRANGLVMIVWHACPSGPGSCDVFGRFVLPTPELVGEPFVVSTNTAADQTNPSVTAIGDSFVVAWTDASGTVPDTSGSSVRARIVVPDL